MLRAYWVLAILALVVNVGTYTVLFIGSGEQLASVLPKPKSEGVPREEYIPFWDFYRSIGKYLAVSENLEQLMYINLRDDLLPKS